MQKTKQNSASYSRSYVFDSQPCNILAFLVCIFECAEGSTVMRLRDSIAKLEGFKDLAKEGRTFLLFGG